MAEQHEKKQKPGAEPLPNHINVSVVTTSGTYPPGEEYVQVPSHQKVEQVLKDAARKLELTNTNGWVAQVNRNPIDPNKNYIENGLAGQVDIDWGPTEGGGGGR